VDALIEQSRLLADPAQRFPLLQDAEKRIVSDAPWVFLTHGQTHLLVKPYVHGLRIGPMDVGTSVNQVDFHSISF